MTEPMISWRPGWVSEWDGSVLICVRDDYRTTARPPIAPAAIVEEVNATVPGHMPAARAVLTEVCGEYGITFKRLCLRTFPGACDRASVSWPRYDAIARLRAIQRPDGKSRYSWPQIAALVGRFDHSTCMTGYEKWQEIEAWIAGFDWPETDAKREAEAA